MIRPGGISMEWMQNLKMAIDYIEDNLEGEISYEKAAQISGCSVHYFQRIFTGVTGISLSEYIRRRRMTQAGLELQADQCKVIDVALKYGYTSPTAFNRAFQMIHGITPAAAKKSGSRLNAYPPIKFKVSVSGEEALRYRIEEKKAMRLIGITTPLVEDMTLNQINVPHFWQTVIDSDAYDKIHNLSMGEPSGIIGCSVYQHHDDFYYAIAAASSQAVPEGMQEIIIPKATWVIFECCVPYKDSVQKIFQRFVSEWLPFSGYRYAMLPDLEIYPFYEDYEQSSVSEVWIAIEKERER